MFMGTPEFAAVSLEALIKNGEDVACVISQPYKPKNRGMKLVPTAVGAVAEKNSILLKTPETLKDKAILPLLSEVEPDLIAVVAYGKLLPQYVLDFPKYGCINIHGSLLPKYRGAAPIQQSIISGEKETGVTSMYMARGMDTGDMILKESIKIEDNDTAGTLHDKLAVLGAEVLIKTVDMIKKGGLDPWPSAYSYIKDKRSKIFGVSAEDKNGAPGEILEVSDTLLIAAGKGALRIREVGFDNKKRMPVSDFVRGNGDVFKKGEMLK